MQIGVVSTIISFQGPPFVALLRWGCGCRVRADPFAPSLRFLQATLCWSDTYVMASATSNLLLLDAYYRRAANDEMGWRA